MEKIFKSVQFIEKGFDDDKRIVKGYVSVFENVDSDKDRLMKGAFKRTLKEWGPEGMNRIKLVSQHNMRVPVGPIMKLYEDEKGLYMEAKFGTHRDGEDHYRMVKEGTLTEFSIGFVGYNKEDNTYGGRDFKAVDLYEVSLVTMAANDQAVVSSVKSVEDELSDLDGIIKLASKLGDSEETHKIKNIALNLKAEAKKAHEAAIVKENDLSNEAIEEAKRNEELLKIAKSFGITH